MRRTSAPSIPALFQMPAAVMPAIRQAAHQQVHILHLPHSHDSGAASRKPCAARRSGLDNPPLPLPHSATLPMPDLADTLRSIRRDLRAEYLQPHDWPWIIGFSGGKDSTILAHLVVDMLQQVAPSDRRRPIHIVCNDTLVESPMFHSFVQRLLDQMEEGFVNLGLPVGVVRTHPLPEESFWVNLLGRGYPAPNRSFRWCTDRMKIRPTSRFIRSQVEANGQAVLLLGVRRDESSSRAQRITRNNPDAASARLSPHNDHKGVWVFTPIKDLETTEVWAFLLQARPPWGGNYRDLVKLYRDADGGSECPFVQSEADSPSCGSSSARFGCWTCTVVEKDKSLDSLIDSGHEHLEPLSRFRLRLREASENPDWRSKIRRNGQPGLGPLTIAARRLLLDELLDVQTACGLELISSFEVMLVREQWEKDLTTEVRRAIDVALPACV